MTLKADASARCQNETCFLSEPWWGILSHCGDWFGHDRNDRPEYSGLGVAQRSTAGHRRVTVHFAPNGDSKMKRLVGMLAAIPLLVGWGTAQADTFDPLDPLISYSCTGASGGCAQNDNGVFTPLSNAGFGWKIAPGPATGNLTIGIFVPTNEINIGTFALPQGTDNGGNLAAAIKIIALLNVADGASIATYLGLPNAGSYSPTDNFANLSAGELAENAGFGGNFLSFKITIPNITLDGQGAGSTLLNEFNFGSNLPAGTVIVGFFEELTGPNPGAFVGTAASNDLVITPALVDTTPLPAAVWLFGSALGGGALLLRRRKKKAAALAVA
jgi:hypothetical protein